MIEIEPCSRYDNYPTRPKSSPEIPSKTNVRVLDIFLTNSNTERSQTILNTNEKVNSKSKWYQSMMNAYALSLMCRWLVMCCSSSSLRQRRLSWQPGKMQETWSVIASSGFSPNRSHFHPNLKQKKKFKTMPMRDKTKIQTHQSKIQKIQMYAITLGVGAYSKLQA